MRPTSKDLFSCRDYVALAVGGALLAMPLAAALADSTLPPISIGAGIRTSFVHTDPPVGQTVDDFNLDNIRLYVNGSVTDQIKFTFNTEYQGSPPGGTNSVQVMDAIARFEMSDMFNVWAGRFLPPSDRANLYGAFYANNWNFLADGVQDNYPCTAVGRDNGVAYWGQFGIVKIQAGAFDGPALSGCGTPGRKSVLGAVRVTLDFLDPEPGYYLNGTYYGDKDILAVGLAGQTEAGKKGYSADLLFEKKLGAAGAVTFESEYNKDQHLTADVNDSHGYFLLASYLTPMEIGIGKLQPLVRYAKKTFKSATLPDTDLKTTEVDFNYIIKQFNARISLFYLDQKLNSSGKTKIYGLGVQLQM
jgi:hypothetical protein